MHASKQMADSSRSLTAAAEWIVVSLYEIGILSGVLQVCLGISYVVMVMNVLMCARLSVCRRLISEPDFWYYNGMSYIEEKTDTATRYSQNAIPEIGVDGLASVSMFNIFLKGHLVAISLSLLIAFRGWLHPERAAILHCAPLLHELQRRNIIYGNSRYDVDVSVSDLVGTA